ncbi:polysaccharide export protein [Mucilaginibacter conchicola]|uniref:Polysaccharide export protein n=1 Tax=Mucilaginibacter conchicola TaxID=2303333 RepID=A0A372NXT6_9SPHI|nr:polysaccharide biosynthesis/export family protein [Mucilaginibacter conchicola]RFZ94852.1 polysaccharide export protein [Mucilaginibacter conchicola]
MLKKIKSFNKFILLAFLGPVILSSCASYKKIPYFQDLSVKDKTEEITNYSAHTIAPKDELLIHIGSLSPEGALVFNNNMQTATNAVNTPVYDYLVNDKGEVNLPIIGLTKVAGMTTDELSASLNERLKKYLKEPRTSVRFLNFKVTIMGDVARPNVYSSTSERLTVPEALSLAGDLNVTAARDVLLVREINGKREYYHIDMTSANLFESPYYYLKSNDLLYVKPGKLKVSTIETAGYRRASLIIGILSVLATSAYLIFNR